jgi:hypothetical protein
MQETSANFYKILADIRDTLTGGIRRHLQTRRSSATCDVPPNTKVFGYMRHLQTRRCSATCDVPNTKVFGYMRCAFKHEGVRLRAGWCGAGWCGAPDTKVFGYRCRSISIDLVRRFLDELDAALVFRDGDDGER